MRRVSIRSAMIAIAVLALFLAAGIGLWRRSQRLEALALRYGREANRLENLWVSASNLPKSEGDELGEAVHWNDSVANAYRHAASRPWILSDPDPAQIECPCGHHAGVNRAGQSQPHPAP